MSLLDSFWTPRKDILSNGLTCEMESSKSKAKKILLDFGDSDLERATRT